MYLCFVVASFYMLLTLQVNFEIPYLAIPKGIGIYVARKIPPKKIELPEELTIVHGSTLEVVRQKWGESDGLGSQPVVLKTTCLKDMHS